MRKFIITSLLFIITIVSYSQCPTEDVVLNSQAEVDAFATDYPGCTQLTVGLTIEGNDITDLSGLNQIISIESYFRLVNNTVLESMSGLNEIELIGDSAGILISNNALLISLSNFSGVAALGIRISDNPLLTTLKGFSGMTNCYDFYVDTNLNLGSLEGIEAMDIFGVISINNNINLTSILGLQGVVGVVEELFILNNDLLINLNGLNNITALNNKQLGISGNDSLISLEGLEGLEFSTELFIAWNENLIDISSLDELVIGDYIWISENPNLSFCNINSICIFLEGENGSSANFNNNGSGCETKQEVEEACGILDINSIALKQSLNLYPNPVSETLNISFSENIVFQTATVYSILGGKIVETREKHIDFSNFSSGIYFVEVATSQGMISKKVVKK